MERVSPEGVKTSILHAVHQVREWLRPPSDLPTVVDRDWLHRCMEKKRVFLVADPEKHGQSTEIRVRGQDAAGYWVIERVTGERFASFATARSCQIYLSRNHEASRQNVRDKVGFLPYTSLGFRGREKGSDTEYYQGRPRITSASPVQGGVYLPEQLKTMEAIVVDWEKDAFLRQYAEFVSQEFLSLIQHGKVMKSLDIVRLLQTKILQQFPYQSKMLTSTYAASRPWYSPNTKVYLGEIMRSNDCICRHHALVFAAVMEFMQSTNAPTEVRQRLQGVQVRYLAETMKVYSGEELNRTSGHAYCGVALPEQALIVDPSGEVVASLSELALRYGESTTFRRYLYSLARFSLDTVSSRPLEQEFLRIARWGRGDAVLRQILMDACHVSRNRERATAVMSACIRSF